MRIHTMTFDCYGTLIDWEAGIARAFEQEGAKSGVAVDREEVLMAYHAAEADVESRDYRPYRSVLDETAGRVAARLLKFRMINPHFLSESLPEWDVFPDTNGALEVLRSNGVRMGILSNTDDDLISRTCRRFSVDFDFVITAQQVRSYKPADPHFVHARERIGAQRWMHVAQSWFHDIVPAARLGIAAAWINRKNEPRGEKGAPVYECGTLQEFADAVLSRRVKSEK